MNGVPSEYIGLLRKVRKEESSAASNPSPTRPLKKRKRGQVEITGLKHPVESDGGSIKTDQSTLEHDVTTILSSTPSPVLLPQSSSNEIIEIQSQSNSSDEGDSDDFEDIEFEDVDIEYSIMDLPMDASLPSNNGETPKNSDEIRLSFPQPNRIVKVKRRAAIISKEERLFRKNFHLLYIGSMIAHGVIRNRWCNDFILQASLRKLVSPNVYKELHPRKDLPSTIRSRRFLDGLRNVMTRWSDLFKITSRGLIRKNWNELSMNQPEVEAGMNLEKFRYLISRRRGSRDLGAQAFVALLRSLNVRARLVFSLQPPDFTSTAILPKSNQTGESEETLPERKKKWANSKQKALHEMRLQTKSNDLNQLGVSPYPVFWAEAWNKHTNKWVSIDPIVFRFLETVKTKSKLEPPSTDNRNNMLYAIAYDRAGGVRDVTRRYSQFYNAKTRKKRVTKDENFLKWYENFLVCASSSIRKESNQNDVFELQDFERMNIAEGIPNSIQDFKNHPIYALETQIRQDEVIHPKTSCGMLRIKGKSSDMIPIYKRCDVYRVRTAKAWYMRGKVLKMGEKPLMIKTNNKKTHNSTDSEDDDDTDIRLYAEFQTETYVPEPILNGKVPKNAFGNIDVYTESMIPTNGRLITSPFAATASKIVGVDFASAVTGFDFNKRSATAKIGGVVVAKEFAEAIEMVCNHLKEEEVIREKRRIEEIAIKNWKYFITKLRIANRLNVQHGNIDNLDNEKSSIGNTDGNDHNDDSSGFADRSWSADGEILPRQSEIERFEDVNNEAAEIKRNVINQLEEQQPGGFLAEDIEVSQMENQEPGGFLAEDIEVSQMENQEPGGFLAEDIEFSQMENQEPGGFLLDTIDDTEPIIEEEIDEDDDVFLDDEELGILIESNSRDDPDDMQKTPIRDDKIDSTEVSEEIDENEGFDFDFSDSE